MGIIKVFNKDHPYRVVNLVLIGLFVIGMVWLVITVKGM